MLSILVGFESLAWTSFLKEEKFIMKLKKIASLALAGVMAVSVLAGCGNSDDNGSSTPNQGGTEVVPSSVVADAFNSKQGVTNAVKIDFTADATMEKNLQKAVDLVGNYPSAAAAYVLNDYQAITGLNTTARSFKAAAYDEIAPLATGLNALLKANGMAATGIYDAAFYAPAAVTAANSVPDGTTHTYMLLTSIKQSANVRSAEVAANNVATQVNAYLLRQLDEDSFNGGSKPANTKYYAYSYTGTAGAVTGTASDGNEVYYIAVTITQTVSVKTTPSV